VIRTIQHPAHSREFREVQFDEQGFFWVNTPIITASDAEGAGALFRVSTLDLANLPA
jgi:aspartyl/asparaginyl-tRNA synthetase